MEEEPGTTPGPDGATVEECEDMIRRSFRTPMVKFLREHMGKAGCGVGEKFVKAVNCDKKIAGGYVRGEGAFDCMIFFFRLMRFHVFLVELYAFLQKIGQIMVCSNHMITQDDVNQVVKHELIHAYDDCRAANLDWADCAHHACSEIRAGHLSGDCHYKRELLRGYMKLRGHEQVSSNSFVTSQIKFTRVHYIHTSACL
ncbi:hypothetical protein OIU76_019769 [Salix suchowensis]|nr:hypothetical protein OIU76_019769 [Salix suchowensis]